MRIVQFYFLGIVAAIFTALAPHQVHAEGTKLRCVTDNSDMSRIEVNADAIIDPRPQKDTEVLLQFKNSLSNFNPDRDMTNCENLIQGVQSGYNSLLLTFFKPGQSRIVRTQKSFTLEFTSAKPELNQEQSLERKLTHAQLLLTLGERQQAFQELEQLHSEYNTYETAMALASAKSGAGLARQSAQLISQAFGMQPPDQASIDFQREVTFALAPSIAFDSDYIDGGDSFSQNKSSLALSLPLTEDLAKAPQLYLAWKTNRSDFEDIRNLQGHEQSLTIDRQQLRARVASPIAENSELGLQAFGGEGRAGAGTDFVHRDEVGAWLASLVFQEPDWSYASQVAFKGTRDRLLLSRERYISPKLQAEGSAAFQNYSLQSENNAARSGAIKGSLRYLVFSGPIDFNLNYRLDAEYFLDREERVTSQGSEFNLLGAESREFHVLSLGLGKTLRNFPQTNAQTALSGYAGYAVDRLGENVPELGAVLRSFGSRGPELKIELGRTLSSFGASSSQTRVAALLQWRF